MWDECMSDYPGILDVGLHVDIHLQEKLSIAHEEQTRACW